MLPDRSTIHSIVADTLSQTVESHEAAIEGDCNRRAALQMACSRHYWDYLRNWCRTCGMTMERLMFPNHERN